MTYADAAPGWTRSGSIPAVLLVVLAALFAVLPSPQVAVAPAHGAQTVGEEQHLLPAPIWFTGCQPGCTGDPPVHDVAGCGALPGPGCVPLATTAPAPGPAVAVTFVPPPHPRGPPAAASQ